ncbi:hypothetical protein ACFSJY_15940 [Thalassotalea euphylliae]|uniref:hypothetical protein n=1 Tax=Thalassotalea euphylliae TaxID=1655234 RepID=UPI00362FE09C
MMRVFLLFISFFGFFLSAAEIKATQVVRYNISLNFTDNKQSYYIDLLDLAMKNTVDEYGPYRLEAVVVEMPLGRTAIMVEKQDVIDITWQMTSRQLEQKLGTVYWPLLKGMMGHRIFIINKGDQPKFPADMSEEQLKELVAGQGNDWPDAKIMEHNGYRVTTSPAMAILNMLEKRRLDYFPRAIHEPWTEIAQRNAFRVEQHILLKYPAPMFFFVKKENTELQQRLSLGLERAYQNGDIDRLFATHPITSEIMERAQLEKRQVFELENPLLSENANAAMARIGYYGANQ